MARKMAAATKSDSAARLALLAAAEVCLARRGYAGLTTRSVAEEAKMPLSQIHYHFGSKDALILALLDHQNRRLLDRQKTTFASDLPLWRRWELACDYLDEDLASGYVRVLQEMMAAGWSNAEVAAAVKTFLGGWYDLLASVAEEATEKFGGLHPLEPDDIACLVGNAFLGCEAMLLLGFEDQGMPIRRALRRFGILIRHMEQGLEAS